MRENLEREGVGKGQGGEGSRARPRGFVHRLDQETTSFFFTNFPEDAKVVDLWSRFGRFGRVGEVYIPKKVDKQGRQFGFVKFRDVSDARELLRTISDIWMGSFKLRVNLAKFRKNNQPEATGEQRKGLLMGQKTTQVDKSFKNALMAVDSEDGSGGYHQGNMAGAQTRPEVVWEVEVEDEVMSKLSGAYVGYLVDDKEAITIQNQFRMDGLQYLKVCVLGFMKILLWSDKVGEVKEVVESVGWWCSLFEKVVPWSPALVSNQRVTWIRYYGVPLHAWGIDLFRALAFKFGRFIDIDEQTKLMSKCDVARVKILSGESRLIDASMAVKVQGQRFDIRIVEESGGWTDGGCPSGKRIGVEDDFSSKASSHGGVSVVAVAEGFSETGSDADVSESCQVLLEVEKRGGGGNDVDGVLGRLKGSVGESQKLPPIFWESLEKSAGTDRFEERGDVGPTAEQGGVVEVIGPAHRVEGEVCGNFKKRGVEVQGRGVPKFLRTKKGDLDVFGPSNSGPLNQVLVDKSGGVKEVGFTQAHSMDSLESSGVHPDLAGGAESYLGRGKEVNGFQFRSKRVLKKHSTTKHPTTMNFPLKMLRKLSGSFYGIKKGRKRKGPYLARRSKSVDVLPSSSDSIHCSSVVRTNHEVFDNTNLAPTGFELEIVLPLQQAEGRNSSPSDLVAVSRAGVTVEGEGSVVGDSTSSGGQNSNSASGQPMSREVSEAKKLIAINEELGLTFYDCEGEDVERMVAMEGRDRAEKNGWETKIEAFSDSLPQCLWGSDDCDWACLPAVGNSGGLLSMWKKSSFSLVFSFSGHGFVGAVMGRNSHVSVGVWRSADAYGKAEVKKKNLIELICEIDLRSETMGISSVEAELRKRLFDELWVLLKSIDASIFQRSRAKWLKEGDANTRYFHYCINARKRSNSILALNTQEGWVEDPVGVREATVTFFKKHFDNEVWNRPRLEGVVLPELNEVSNGLLVDTFMIAEIEKVVKNSDGSKCPGPDGFNFAFIKEFWGMLRSDVRILFDQFHANDCIPNCLMSYFLTLVPKIKSPQSLGDFRPISLLGCLYKLLAKVLAARLARAIGPLIPNTQTAFLKGRQLVEGVVVVNEVIDYAKKTGKECLILKVDFEKAYDSVDWGFLDYMLQRFGFCAKWRAWVRACVCAGKMSVLLNGCPTEEINIRRGLKQGDPLAPLLFLLVADGLGALMRRAVEVNRFKPFLVGREGVPVSILQYADDTLCIGEATVDNLWTLKAMLRGFEMASGLKVNFWKSCLIGVNVANDFLDMATEFLNCQRGLLPFKYLGLPVGANPRNLSTWEPMLKAVKVFYLSYLKMPVKVWKEVVKIQRDFLWGGLSKRTRICWVRWNDICKPKKEAGLGFKDLRVVNISLLTKWRWKLLSHQSEVWKDVVMAKYGPHISGKGNLGVSDVTRMSSTWWKDICNLDKDSSWFVEAVEKRVGNGNLTAFWTDTWIGDQSLQQRFPRIYGISNQKESTIFNMGRWVENTWSWEFDWRRNLFVWEEPIKAEFLDVINQFVPSERDDLWLWRENKDDGFSVKSCYDMLQNKFSLSRVLEPSEEVRCAVEGVCFFMATVMGPAANQRQSAEAEDFASSANYVCDLWYRHRDECPSVSSLRLCGQGLVCFNEVARFGCNYPP
ncbi:hypothetical protein TSUD_292720 [Trifolium subterraneum]|uniref:RRM domain-containing protein n=1 Tax=Trifolium subterraneum TaxID=3900 RepID=A0A2Z6N5P6_TRISU|nr:hypothetical protein TSUD_292720 [Trifolium subterraneum]